VISALPNKANLNQTEAEILSRAVEALKHGEVIVFPTETLYGLGADAFNDTGVERVFELKGRNRQQPIPVLVADLEMVGCIVDEIPSAARRLMDRFWPGPLTIVLRARKGIPEPLVNANGGVGVRISSHPVASQLVRALGRPLTATSANRSGEEPARSLEEARQIFDRKIDVYVGGGTLTSKTGSTVVEIDRNGLKVIREGDISSASLREIFNRPR
jgi:L-threonylcarbamoyladenylate synthase